MDAITINETKPVANKFLKRRLWGRSWLIYAGNIFLKQSHSHILMFPRVREWQAWECYCYSLLYNGGCELLGKYALLIDPFSGESLRVYLESGRLTDSIIAVVGQEFKRVHSLGTWSHGDPHLANIISDGVQARFIDFETKHDPFLSPTQRHADDLLVFLLDLMGRDKSNRWLDWSRILFVTYSDQPVLDVLYERLRLPKGMERILWKSRTNYLPISVLAERLAELRRVLSIVQGKGADHSN